MLPFLLVATSIGVPLDPVYRPVEVVQSESATADVSGRCQESTTVIEDASIPTTAWALACESDCSVPVTVKISLRAAE